MVLIDYIISCDECTREFEKGENLEELEESLRKRGWWIEPSEVKPELIIGHICPKCLKA